MTSGTYKCERVHFDMGQLCDEVSERYDAICAQNGWQLQLELPEEEPVSYTHLDVYKRQVRAVGEATLPMGVLGVVNGQSRVVHLTAGGYAVLVSDGLLVDGLSLIHI